MRTRGLFDATRRTTVTCWSPQTWPLFLFCSRRIQRCSENTASMKNTQVKHIFSCMARSPTHLSPVVITLCFPTGATVHSLHLLPDVSLPLFSHWGHQSRAEPTQVWTTSLFPMCLLRHDWPPCSQKGSSLFVASVVCCHPRQTYQCCEPLRCARSQQCQRKDSLLPEQLAAFLGSGSSGFCYWSKNFFFLGFRDMPVWFIEKLLSYQQMQVHYSLTVRWNNHRNGSCLLLFEEESARYSHHRNPRAQAILQT